MNLISGGNTVCWLPRVNNGGSGEKYNTGQSFKYTCPAGSKATEVLFDLDSANDRDYFEMYKVLGDGSTACLERYGYESNSNCAHTNPATSGMNRVDLSWANANTIRLYFHTDGDQVRSRENAAPIGVYVKKITCS